MAPTALNCDELGSGDSLVLLHPVGLDNTFWEGLPEAAARTHRVIKVDLCGHGRSPAATKGRSFNDYVDDVHAAIAAHGAAPATVLGLSFGGMLAQELALRHPGDVAALIICGCASQIPEAAQEAIRERGLAAERGGMASVVPPTLKRWFTAPYLSSRRVRDVEARLLAASPSCFSAAWHAIADFDCTERLKTVGVPSLVIAGENDAATPLPAAQLIAESIPGAAIRVLRGAPHMMQIEYADAFIETVCAFLTEIGKGGGAGAVFTPAPGQKAHAPELSGH